MDNPQIIQATYQNMLTPPNSAYLPWKKIPKMAKDSRAIRVAPNTIANKFATKEVLPNRMPPLFFATAIIPANRNVAIRTLTRKTARNTDRWSTWWCPSTPASVRTTLPGMTRNGINDHVGPPLCRKYAIPIHGRASILATSFAYRITENDSPSNASSCPWLALGASPLPMLCRIVTHDGHGQRPRTYHPVLFSIAKKVTAHAFVQ